jgi:hypothetical protein
MIILLTTVSSFLKKILKKIWEIILKILVFFSHFFIRFTGEKRKIFKVESSDPQILKLIYIGWGIIGFIILLFSIYLLKSINIFGEIIFDESEIYLHTFFVLLASCIIFNIYYLSIKTTHFKFDGVTNSLCISILPYALIKIVFISFFLFFTTLFYNIYRNNVAVNNKIEEYTKTKILVNNYISNCEVLIKMKDEFSKSQIQFDDSDSFDTLRENIGNAVKDIKDINVNPLSIYSTNNKLTNDLQQSASIYSKNMVLILRQINKIESNLSNSISRGELKGLRKMLVLNEAKKQELKQIIENTNHLSEKIKLSYYDEDFFSLFFFSCVFFNFIFLLKILLLWFDSSFKENYTEEDTSIEYY